MKREYCCSSAQEANKGVCGVQTFWGISLTSLVSKVLCKILKNRLSCMAEEKGLITEEQGGFHKGRGCRHQLLSLVLLGWLGKLTIC